MDADAVKERVVELAEEGLDPSQIGMTLRDEGVAGTPVPNVKLATGEKIGQILDNHDASPSVPEDFRNLLERAVRLREHVEANPQDASNRRALQNAESKLRRLADYYRGDELDEDFRYSYDAAVDLLEDA